MKGTPEGSRPFVVRMPNELYDEFKAAVKRDERSMAQTIRYLIREYVTAADPQEGDK